MHTLIFPLCPGLWSLASSRKGRSGWIPQRRLRFCNRGRARQSYYKKIKEKQTHLLFPGHGMGRALIMLVMSFVFVVNKMLLHAIECNVLIFNILRICLSLSVSSRHRNNWESQGQNCKSDVIYNRESSCFVLQDSCLSVSCILTCMEARALVNFKQQIMISIREKQNLILENHWWGEIA